MPSIGRPSGIDDAADELRTDRHLEHARGAANLVAFLELEVVAENDGADVVLFEIQRERGDLLAGLGRGDLEHLAGHRLLEAVDAGDAVLDFEDGANLFDVELVEVSGFDLAKEDVLDLAGAECGVGCHAPCLWSRIERDWRGGSACEKYHKEECEARES